MKANDLFWSQKRVEKDTYLICERKRILPGWDHLVCGEEGGGIPFAEIVILLSCQSITISERKWVDVLILVYLQSF